MMRSANTRLRVEELEGRDAPAVLTGLGEIEDVPPHVSLAAVAALALCVCWDRRTREHHLRKQASIQSPIKVA
jgi:hypothetical protein